VTTKASGLHEMKYVDTVAFRRSQNTVSESEFSPGNNSIVRHPNNDDVSQTYDVTAALQRISGSAASSLKVFIITFLSSLLPHTC